MNRSLLPFALLAIFIFSTPQLFASHAMGADIYYEYLTGNQYRISAALYRDCTGIPAPSNLTVYVSSSCLTGSGSTLTLNQEPGTGNEVTPLCPSDIGNSACNGGSLPGVQQYVYSALYSLSCQAADWTFGVSENSRNPSDNLQNAGSHDLYVEATLNNLAGNNNSPTFTNLPVPFICATQPQIYNHGAADSDGDSLVYSLVTPLDFGATPLSYIAPYSATYPLSTSSGTFSFDVQTGAMNFTPNTIQTCVVSIRVDEYRNGTLIGSTMRDIQVVVLSCSNQSPVVAGPVSLTGGALVSNTYVSVCPNTTLSFQLQGSDPDGHNVVQTSGDIGINLPAVNFTTANNGTPMATSGFSWTPGPADIGIYSFTLQIQDDGCPLNGTNIYTYTIDVGTDVTVGNDTALCGGNISIQLSASGGSGHTWGVISGDVSSLSCSSCSNPIVSPNVTTLYQVVNACGGFDQILVSKDDLTLSVPPDLAICKGQQTSLSVNLSQSCPGCTYSWSPSAGLNSTGIPNPTADPLVSTTYKVEVNNGFCLLTDEVSVQVADTPAASVIADPAFSCGGSPVNLEASVSPGSCMGYTVLSTPYVPATGSGTAITLTDDQEAGPFSIGFSFDFFCESYTQFFVAANGMLMFTNANVPTAADAIPAMTDPDNFIALAWTDLNPPNGGLVHYFTEGSAPNRRLVLHFNAVRYYGSSSTVSGQIILFESTNEVDIVSIDVQASGANKTQGIEGPSGNLGYPVSGRNLSVWSSAGESWRFRPILNNFTYSIAWQSPVGNTIGTGSPMAVTPTADSSFYAVISNDSVPGCALTQQLDVEAAYLNTSPNQLACNPTIGNPVALNATYFGPVFSTPAACGPAIMACTGSTTDYLPATGTGSTLTHNPYRGLWEDARTQMLFTASELNSSGFTGGTIEALALNVVSKQSSLPYSGFTIKMGCTPISSLNGFQTGLTTVFGPVAVNTTAGWNVHSLATGYDWDGTSNLIIEICFDNNNFSDNDPVSFATTPFTSFLSNYTDGSAGCNLTGTSINDNIRPTVRFSACTSAGVTYSWSPNMDINDYTVGNPMVYPASSTTYYVTVTTGSCSLLDSVFVEVDCPFSIQALQFSGEKAGDEARLFWRTSFENGTEWFVVERRDPQSGSFMAIGNVPASGYTTEGMAYSFSDRNPYPGTNLYRLLTHFSDGGFEYSQNVEIDFSREASGLISVYPNPGTGMLWMDLWLAEGTRQIKLEIFSLAGMKVFSDSFLETNPGRVRIPVDLRRLPGGVYLYALQIDGIRQEGKITLTE
jgi:hypothetical protein